MDIFQMVKAAMVFGAIVLGIMVVSSVAFVFGMSLPFMLDNLGRSNLPEFGRGLVVISIFVTAATFEIIVIVFTVVFIKRVTAAPNTLEHNGYRWIDGEGVEEAAE